MGSPASFGAFVVCISILSGSIGAAFGRRYSGCEPVVLADDHGASSLNIADFEPMPAASTAASGDALVREVVTSPPTFDSAPASKIAALEAENARLKSELGTTRFASMLVASAPADRPLGLAHAMHLLDDSYLTELPELRAMFVQEVRQDAAIELLKAEPRFRTALARARRAGAYEWPVRRDQLVQDFVLRLSDAGLSSRTIEHYRTTLVDYLDG